MLPTNAQWHGSCTAGDTTLFEESAAAAGDRKDARTAAAVSERTKSAAAVASQQVLLHIDCSLPHHGLYDLCSCAMLNTQRGPLGMMMKA